MSVSSDLVLTFWQDQRAQAQRAEDQRVSIANILLTISAVGFGFVSQQGVRLSTLPVSLGLLLIGLYGALASAKLYERYRLHMAQAAGFAAALEELNPGLDLEMARRIGREKHNQRFRTLHRVRLHVIWTGLHLSIAFSGLLLALFTLLSSHG